MLVEGDFAKGDFELQGLSFQDDVSLARLQGRQQVLGSLDTSPIVRAAAEQAVEQLDLNYHRAFSLLENHAGEALDLRGSTLASGVSPEVGTVPGFGERVIEVPVTVSALSALRQVFGFATGSSRSLDYVLRGRFGGDLGRHSFESTGKLDWPVGALP